MMAIGFCGAHRTGKTTLAREYAERFDLEFIETDVSQIIKDFGWDTKGEIPIYDRIVMQREILKLTLEKYDESDKNFVTDRTPMDMAAYTLMEINMHNANDLYDYDEILYDYIWDCYDATNKYLSVIVMVQPGIEIVDDPDKAASSIMYIEAINTMLKGLLLDSRLYVESFRLNRHLTDLEERIESVNGAIERRIAQIYDEAVQLPINFN